MTVITEDGEILNTYVRVDEESDDLAAVDGRPLVSLALAERLGDGLTDGGFGLWVPNDAEIGAIEPYLQRAALIAIAFPSFSDGRGFSLARRLRRAGFTGTLRASGPLIADQFAEAIACGFDEVELPETMANRQPVQQWMAAKDAVHEHYQRGYGATRSILEKRRAARAGDMNR